MTIWPLRHSPKVDSKYLASLTMRTWMIIMINFNLLNVNIKIFYSAHRNCSDYFPHILPSLEKPASVLPAVCSVGGISQVSGPILILKYALHITQACQES